MKRGQKLNDLVEAAETIAEDPAEGVAAVAAADGIKLLHKFSEVEALLGRSRQALSVD
jgi:hypothetical protein